MSNNTRKFPQPPDHRELVRQEHAENYNKTPELAVAYRAWKEADPGAYFLMADFDHKQGMRNWVNKARQDRIGYDVADQTAQLDQPLEYYFTTDPVGRQQLAVAQLIIDGYNRREVAVMLGLTYDRVRAIVAEVGVIMADGGAS